MQTSYSDIMKYRIMSTTTLLDVPGTLRTEHKKKAMLPCPDTGYLIQCDPNAMWV